MQGGSSRKVVGVWNVGLKDEQKEIPPKQEGSIRIICLSDTHEDERELEIPDGDILIHAGDFSYKGEGTKIAKFNEFLASMPHKHKVVIAGNHDVTFEEEYYNYNWQRFHRKKQDVQAIRASLTNCIYLEDSSVTLFGMLIYGSPWQPAFYNWAFNLPKGGPKLREMWEKIPANTDILITHGPPKGHGDTSDQGVSCGCEELLARIKVLKPALHIFGHIHEGYGITNEGPTTCVNASNNTVGYATINRPIVIDIM